MHHDYPRQNQFNLGMPLDFPFSIFVFGIDFQLPILCLTLEKINKSCLSQKYS